MNLQSLRKKIDRLDSGLLRLLNERGFLVKEVAALKAKSGQSVFVPGRERNLLESLKKANRGPLSPDAVESVFREIVHACRGLEKRLRVVYFGPAATYTHQAALRSFGQRAELIPVRTIPDVFAEVEKGHADYGVVPVENSTEGVVNHTLDMFTESTLSICSELELPIWHFLLGNVRGSQGLKGVKRLFAHYQALAQTRGWLETHLPGVPVIEASSTAESARLASKNVGSAAVASRLAADVYGLKILGERIEDNPQNFTRFFVIGTAEPQATGRDKTSLMVSVKDRVGALYDLLLPFKKAKVNMTKIESRPTGQRRWEYVFFVDFLGHRTEPRVQKLLQGLERSCVFLKVLGSYPRVE